MKPRILVADDDEGIRDIFRLIFANSDFSIELIADGEDMFHDKFTIPDIFLIDKQLSGVSGLDVCRYLKGHPKTSQIPVVMVSASPDIATLSIEAGADGYIEKPFDIALLVQVIRKFIGLKDNSEVFFAHSPSV